MLISAYPILVLGAGLAIQATQAAPIKLTFVSSSIKAIDAPPQPVVSIGGPLTAVHFTGGGVLSSPPKKLGCGGLKNKSLDITNSLRKAFGLETVQTDGAVGDVHILPFVMPESFGKGPDAAGRVEVFEETMDREVATIPHPHHYRLRPSGSSPEDDQNFIQRIHSALVALGPWEARAVAFVLGCGIGVLFRMIWVFAVLLFRGGCSEDGSDEAQYALVIENVPGAEELPPKYTSDEKHDLN